MSVIGVITENSEEGSAKEKGASQRGMFDQLDDRAVAGVLGHVLDSEKAGELLVVTEMGSGFRFVADFVGPTTKNGKRVANVKGDDAIAFSYTSYRKNAFSFIERRQRAFDRYERNCTTFRAGRWSATYEAKTGRNDTGSQGGVKIRKDRDFLL